MTHSKTIHLLSYLYGEKLIYTELEYSSINLYLPPLPRINNYNTKILVINYFKNLNKRVIKFLNFYGYNQESNYYRLRNFRNEIINLKCLKLAQQNKSK